MTDRADEIAAECYDCGRPYGHEHGFPDLVVSNEVWDKISPTGHEGGLLCPSCICKRAHDAGIEDAGAVFKSGPFCDLTGTLVADAEVLRLQGVRDDLEERLRRAEKSRLVFETECNTLKERLRRAEARVRELEDKDREITHAADRAQEPQQQSAEVAAIWLTIVADNEAGAHGTVFVDIQMPDGTWQRAIKETVGGHTSHCVNLNHQLPLCETPGVDHD